jgi:hypothetical protein
MSLDVPITLVGFTALSELMKITRSTGLPSAALMMFFTPRMFVWTASKGARSQIVTCFKAAPWNTMSTSDMM